MTPEKRVQNAIVDFMKELIARGEKIDIQRRQAGGYSYKKGIPDLYAIVYGRHLEIEVNLLEQAAYLIRSANNWNCRILLWELIWMLCYKS